MKRFLLLLTLSIVLLTASAVRVSALEATYHDDGASEEELDVPAVPSFRNDTYFRRLSAWLEDYGTPALAEQTQTASSSVLANPDADFVFDAAFGGLVAELETDETVTIPVVVPADGLYEVALDFVMPEAF